jgi:hypothetical protein
MTFTTNTVIIVLTTTQKSNMSMPAAHNAEHKKSTELNNNIQKNKELHNYKEKSGTDERRKGKIRLGINSLYSTTAREQNYTKGTAVLKKSKYQCSSMYTCPVSPNGKRHLLPQRTRKPKLIDNRKEYYIENKNISPWLICNRNIVTKSHKGKINPTQPLRKHEKILPITTRR